MIGDVAATGGPVNESASRRPRDEGACVLSGSLCVGCDFSTKAIHLAAVPLDPDVPGGPWKTSERVAKDRYFHVHRSVRELLWQLEREAGMDAATVCVEKPAGQHIHPSLHELHGVIRAAIPPSIPSTSLYPVQWRQAIGCRGRDTKASGLEMVRSLYPAADDWDEHELDALGICTAWARIQWKHALK